MRDAHNNGGRLRRVLRALCSAGGVLLCGAALPASAESYLIGCRRAETPPTVDGRLDDACWQGADRAMNFTVFNQADTRADPQTTVRLCYDQTYLYIAAELTEPEPERITAAVTERDGAVWDDDSFEIFLDTRNDHRTWHQLIVNANAVLFDTRTDRDGKADRFWNASARMAAGRGDTSWTVEVAIPLADLGLEPAFETVIGANFCRNRMRSGQLSSWAPASERFARPEQFGHIVFGVQSAGLETFVLDRYCEPPQADAQDSADTVNLVPNGTFEQTVPGVEPRFPDYWIEERWSAADRTTVVTDHRAVHSGRRAVRLHAAGQRGLRLHAQLKLEPGRRYTIRGWAMALDGQPAALRILPADTVLELNDSWQCYEADYQHPADMPGGMGLIVEISGGPALVDDVSVVAAGREPQPAPELAADRSRVRDLPMDHAWIDGNWYERRPVEVAEIMGMDAKGVRVTFQVRDLFPGYTYRHLAPDKLRIVDRAAPATPRPFAFLDMDQVEGLTARDMIAFAADVPAYGRTIYDVYVKDREPAAEPLAPLRQWPDWLPPAEYPYALDVERLPVESHPSLRKVQPVLDGTVLWCATTMTKVRRRDLIDYAAQRAELCAARNENIAFQVVLDTSVDLPEVTLAASDLVGNGAVIQAARITLERVLELYLSCPNVGPDGYIGAFGYVPYQGQAGYYPDPLLPCRTADLRAGERRTVWVTIAVPEDADAARYEGAITAAAADGTRLALPVSLRVFDFALPDVKTFQPVFGASLGLPHGRGMDAWQGGDVQRYTQNVGALPFWNDWEAAQALALFLARRGIAPFYYYCQDGGSYPIPWRYKSETEAEYDLSRFAEAAGTLVREYGIRHLFIGSEWRTGWGSPGFTKDGGGDWRTTMSARNQNPQGQSILKSFVSGLGPRLEKLGLAEAARFYITDEPHASVEALTAERAAIIKRGLPQVRTFAAGYGRGRWRDYFEYTDIFAGKFSPDNEQRFRDRGGEYWGPYNRPMFVAAPLAVARVVGLDCWRRGYPSYFHYASQSISGDPFVNPKAMTWNQMGKSASDAAARSEALGGVWPRLTYISGIEPEGLGCFVYPWPVAEPAPPGDVRSWASSIRLEALVQSINDYEYMRLLRERADPETYERFMARIERLLDDGDLGGGTSHDVPELVIFDLDPDAFQELKRDLGAAIEQASKL